MQIYKIIPVIIYFITNKTKLEQLPLLALPRKRAAGFLSVISTLLLDFRGLSPYAGLVRGRRDFCFFLLYRGVAPLFIPPAAELRLISKLGQTRQWNESPETRCSAHARTVANKCH